MSQKVQKTDTGGGFLSIVGLVVTLLVLTVVLVVAGFIGYLEEGDLLFFLDSYFIVGWVAYATIMAGVYSRFSTGGENVVSALVVALLGYLLIYISYYVTTVALLVKGTGENMFDYLFYPGLFSAFMGAIFYEPYIYFFPVVGIAIATGFIYSFSAARKKNLVKKAQVKALEDDFLWRNNGVDLSNPFIRARMWTEQGIRTKQNGGGPVTNPFTDPYQSGQHMPTQQDPNAAAYPPTPDQPMTQPPFPPQDPANAYAAPPQQNPSPWDNNGSTAAPAWGSPSPEAVPAPSAEPIPATTFASSADTASPFQADTTPIPVTEEEPTDMSTPLTAPIMDTSFSTTIEIPPADEGTVPEIGAVEVDGVQVTSEGEEK